MESVGAMVALVEEAIKDKEAIKEVVMVMVMVIMEEDTHNLDSHRSRAILSQAILSQAILSQDSLNQGMLLNQGMFLNRGIPLNLVTPLTLLSQGLLPNQVFRSQDLVDPLFPMANVFFCDQLLRVVTFGLKMAGSMQTGLTALWLNGLLLMPLMDAYVSSTPTLRTISLFGTDN